MISPLKKYSNGKTIKQPTSNQISIKPINPWCLTSGFRNFGKYLVVTFNKPKGKIVDTKNENEYKTRVKPIASESRKNG